MPDGKNERLGKDLEIKISREMLAAGPKAGWGELDPPTICYDIAERVYRAIQAKRRELGQPL